MDEKAKKAMSKCHLCIHKSREEGEDYCDCWSNWLKEIDWSDMDDVLEDDGLCAEFQAER